jgi:hypothetical protein
MLQELYTWEKLRELARQRRALAPGTPVHSRLANRPGAPLARLAGRLLRSAGAGLEGWAEPQPAGRDCCEACS